MRKKIILILLISLLLYVCKNTANSNIQKLELNENILINSKWRSGEIDGFYFEFNKNNSLKMKLPQFYIEEDGNYNIKNNELTTTVKKKNGTNFNSKLYDKNIWHLQNDDESLFFTQKLVSDKGLILYSINTIVKEGTLRKIKDKEVFVLNKKNITLNNNTQIREGAGVDFKINVFKDNDKEYDYIPSGKNITLIARTIKKDKIDNSDNYWYYCFITDWYTALDNRFGWIHGSLLNLE